MALDYDARHLPRSLTDWERLVSALSQVADDTAESSWLEFKGPLDLAKAEGKFAAARTILAFANRDPRAAAPFLDGHALLVIGISAGAISGIPRIEDHDLQRGLQPYLGRDERSPRWLAHRHRVDDKNDLLMLDVDTPRAGDPIYTLRRAYERSPAGTIFTRPSTASEPADPESIEMLSRRLLARVHDFKVDVALNEDAIARFTWDTTVFDQALQREVELLLAPLTPPPSAPRSRPVSQVFDLDTAVMPDVTGVNRIQRLAEQVSTAFVTRHEESRTEDTFRQEVADWAEQLRNDFPLMVLDLLAYLQPAARFTVTNECDRFLEDLEVEVHIAGPITQRAKPTRAKTIDDLAERLPDRPRTWGPWTTTINYALGDLDTSRFVASQLPHVGTTRPARSNSTEFRNSGSVTATLRCDTLRPQREHTFTDDDDHQDVIFYTEDLTIEAAPLRVTATARGIDAAHVAEASQPVQATVNLTDAVRRFIQDSCYFEATPPDPPSAGD